MYRLRGRLRVTALVAVAALGASATGALGAGTAGAASPPALPQIKVTMDPHHLAVSGDLVSGAVTINTQVSGEQEGDFAFIRLNPGVSYAQFYKFVSSHAIDDPNIISAV